jgi:hypothetical protein
MHPSARIAVLLSLSLSVAACAPMLAMVGTNQALVQVIANVERVKLAADGASLASSKKTLTDHALSMAVGKDCKLFNVLAKESVCADSSSPSPTVAIASHDSAPADTPTRAEALDSSIKAAAASELPESTVANNDTEPVIAAGFEMRPNTDTRGLMAKLNSNIKSARAGVQPVNLDTATAVAAETAAKPDEEFTTIPGTNLKRKVDPSIAAASARPGDGSPEIAPTQAKDSAIAAAAPQLPPHDEPRIVQPQAIAHPGARSIEVTREAASG